MKVNELQKSEIKKLWKKISDSENINSLMNKNMNHKWSCDV